MTLVIAVTWKSISGLLAAVGTIIFTTWKIFQFFHQREIANFKSSNDALKNENARFKLSNDILVVEESGGKSAGNSGNDRHKNKSTSETAKIKYSNPAQNQIPTPDKVVVSPGKRHIPGPKCDICEQDMEFYSVYFADNGKRECLAFTCGHCPGSDKQIDKEKWEILYKHKKPF